MKSHIFTIVAIDALVLIAWMMCVDDFRRMPMEQPQVQPATTSAVAVQSDFRRLRNVKVGNVVGQTSQERRVNCVIDKHSLESLVLLWGHSPQVFLIYLTNDKNN